MIRSGWWRPALLIALVGALVAAFRFLPVNGWIQALLTTIGEMGPTGPVFLALAYIIASVLFLPGSLLTLGAGFLFGVVKGTIAVSVGSVLGAAAAFLIGRMIARSWVEGKVSGNSRFRAIDEAVGTEGFKIVLLTRLSPIFPFNLLNYAYGVTKVRLRDYFLASWIGMLPGTLMYVYLGGAVKSISDLAAGNVEGGAGQRILFAVGLIATIVATLFVTRISKRALVQAFDGDPKGRAVEAKA